MVDPIEGPYVVVDGGDNSDISPSCSHDIQTANGLVIGALLGWSIHPDYELCATTKATAELWASSWEMRSILRRIVSLREIGTSGTGDHPDKVADDAAKLLKRLES